MRWLTFLARLDEIRSEVRQQKDLRKEIEKDHPLSSKLLDLAATMSEPEPVTLATEPEDDDRPTKEEIHRAYRVADHSKDKAPSEDGKARAVPIPRDFKEAPKPRKEVELNEATESTVENKFSDE